jgi:Tetracyclin repressor-like, C-terminal domain
MACTAVSPCAPRTSWRTCSLALRSVASEATPSRRSPTPVARGRSRIRGPYPAAQRAPAPGDDDEAASEAIDATRALRSTLHGFVTLEIARGFRLPVDIDRTFDRLIKGLVAALKWTKDRSTQHHPARQDSDALRGTQQPLRSHESAP